MNRMQPSVIHIMRVRGRGISTTEKGDQSNNQ